MAENSQLETSQEGDVTTVKFVSRKILDEVNIMEIGKTLTSLVADTDKPKILLDFSNVSYMSSSALGVLITVHKRIREKQGQLALCGIQPSIYEIFTITRLNEIFNIYETHQKALENLSSEQ